MTARAEIFESPIGRAAAWKNLQKQNTVRPNNASNFMSNESPLF